MRVTLNKVTEAIRALGGAEELVKGNGYFYFAGGNTGSWYSTSVYTYRLSDLTLDQWIDEYKTLSAPR